MGLLFDGVHCGKKKLSSFWDETSSDKAVYSPRVSPLKIEKQSMQEKMRVIGFQSGTRDYFCLIYIYLFIYFI
jgi:hypothetical protein